MTVAQRQALDVLAQQIEPIGAWKRSSTLLPVPRVNIRAVGALVRAGLAQRHWPVWAGHREWTPPSSVFTHNDRYTITPRGRTAYRAGA